ncbi:MAG: hypothetical protein IBJ10_04310 [Phycisphaerales bacterium]|nr:hypothetical protein [Phycisphaerales bacterium]
MKRIALPPALRPFTRRPWPAAALGLACFIVLWIDALPKFAAASEMREQSALQRDLVERQAAIAVQAPAEEARSEALNEWWRSVRAGRVTGRTLDAASGALLDTIRAKCEAAGVRVMSVERSVRSEPILADPPSEIVVVNLRLLGERMEHMAAALAALEADAAPWLRVGNATFTRQPYRMLSGVQAEMTVYACLEASGG